MSWQFFFDLKPDLHWLCFILLFPDTRDDGRRSRISGVKARRRGIAVAAAAEELWMAGLRSGDVFPFRAGKPTAF